MFTISKLAVFLPLISSVFALSPAHNELRSLEARNNNNRCKPNFQGNALSIFIVDPDDLVNNKVYEWTGPVTNGAPVTFRPQFAAQGFQLGDFFIEFSGQADQTHRIKLTADTSRDLLVTISASNEVILSKTVWGSPSQHFSIDCRHCTNDARALGCRIRHPPTNKCITFNFATGTLNNQRLVLGSCLAAEMYYIIPQLSAAAAAGILVQDFDI